MGVSSSGLFSDSDDGADGGVGDGARAEVTNTASTTVPTSSLPRVKRSVSAKGRGRCVRVPEAMSAARL